MVVLIGPSLMRYIKTPVFNLGDILTFPRGHEVGYGVQKKYSV